MEEGDGNLLEMMRMALRDVPIPNTFKNKNGERRQPHIEHIRCGSHFGQKFDQFEQE